MDNCVAINNHRHFALYVLTLAAGIIFYDWLALDYLSAIPRSSEASCIIFSGDICKVLNADPFTITVTLWATIQLVWLIMLVLVQMVQIARGLTTYEAMTGHTRHPHGAGDAITSFVTSGTTSMDQAGLTGGDRGPDPAVQPERPHQKHGCLEQWKRMLGIDTFLATTMFGSNTSRQQAIARSNPFSRGLLQNCRDFWFDPAPVFGSRSNGEALLGGQKVDYTRMYEVPVMTRRSGGRGGGAYEAVAADEEV